MKHFTQLVWFETSTLLERLHDTYSTKMTTQHFRRVHSNEPYLLNRLLNKQSTLESLRSAVGIGQSNFPNVSVRAHIPPY